MFYVNECVSTAGKIIVARREHESYLN